MALSSESSLTSGWHSDHKSLFSVQHYAGYYSQGTGFDVLSARLGIVDTLNEETQGGRMTWAEQPLVRCLEQYRHELLSHGRSTAVVPWHSRCARATAERLQDVAFVLAKIDNC